MILVRQNFCPTLISSDSTVEQVWVHLSLGYRSLYVGGAYIPPRSEAVVYSRLVESCAVVADQLEDQDEMLLVCDLNLPGIGWREDDEHLCTYLPVDISSETEMITIDGLLDLGLRQLNAVPNSYGNVLETVFCTGPDKVQLMCPAPALCLGLGGSTSHQPVSIEFASAPVPSQPPASSSTRRYDFARADYSGLVNRLEETDWVEVLGGADVDA